MQREVCSPHRPMLALLAIVAAATIACFGTTSSPPPDVTPAPIGADEQVALHNMLVGIWKYEETRTSPDEEGRRTTGTERAWSLLDDGRFNYLQQATFSGSLSGSWWLDGRNLHLQVEDGALSIYRVERWSPASMVWYDYRAKQYILVTRADTIQARATSGSHSLARAALRDP